MADVSMDVSYANFSMTVEDEDKKMGYDSFGRVLTDLTFQCGAKPTFQPVMGFPTPTEGDLRVDGHYDPKNGPSFDVGVTLKWDLNAPKEKEPSSSNGRDSGKDRGTSPDRDINSLDKN